MKPDTLVRVVASEDVLRQQREANQALVLSGLRAHEEADEALLGQRQAEAEVSALRSDAEELAATAQFRERLLGIVGHDLRNPLNTITMAAARLTQRGLGASDARLAEQILKSSQRMTRMIAQLAEFTRARLGGGFSLQLEQANLGVICKHVIEELEFGRETAISLITEGKLDGSWDSDRLIQVLSNITGNAIDHATPGTTVELHAWGDGDSVTVEVTNQGAVIAEDLLPQIFMAFRRARAAPAGRSAHLGLGLYISHELVHAHGGSLSVRSADGVTTFKIELPCMGHGDGAGDAQAC